MPQHIYFQPGDIVETESGGECIVLSRRQAKNGHAPLYHLWSYAKRRYSYHNQYNMAMRQNATDTTKNQAHDLLMQMLETPTTNLTYKKGDCVESNRSIYVIICGFTDINQIPYYLVCNIATGGTSYISGTDINKKLADSNPQAQAKAHKILITRIVAPGFPD